MLLSSTNTALGSVIMATQYNASAKDFVNKTPNGNYEFAQSCKPAGPMLHYIECERHSHLYQNCNVRTGPLESDRSTRSDTSSPPK